MAITKSTSLFKTLQEEGVLRIGKALDLGCGRGVDARNFAEAGYTVDAVDKDAELIKGLDQTKGALSIHAVVQVIQDFKIEENAYDFVSSQYALQFLTKEEASVTLENMVKGTKSGGTIAFNLIGERDEWSKRWSTWTKEEADGFVSELPAKVHKSIMEEGVALTKAGPMKWWHVLSYVLIKK